MWLLPVFVSSSKKSKTQNLFDFVGARKNFHLAPTVCHASDSVVLAYTMNCYVNYFFRLLWIIKYKYIVGYLSVPLMISSFCKFAINNNYETSNKKAMLICILFDVVLEESDVRCFCFVSGARRLPFNVVAHCGNFLTAARSDATADSSDDEQHRPWRCALYPGLKSMKIRSILRRTALLRNKKSPFLSIIIIERN